MWQILSAVPTGEMTWSLASTGIVACIALVGVFGVLAYHRLQLQKLCLDTAIDNMSQGLTMFTGSAG